MKSVPLRKPSQIHIYTIAKNEEQFVERWVRAHKDADGLHVLDTGSTDNTAEKLKALGVNVEIELYEPWKTIKEYDEIVKRGGRPWRFDTARNRNLAMIPDDPNIICFQVDMDEVAIPKWREEVLKYFKWNTSHLHYFFAWQMDGDKPRILTNYDKIHTRRNFEWNNPVHEIVCPKRGFKEVIAKCPTTLVLHYPDGGKPRNQYLNMLELACREDPNDQRNFLYYGRELSFNGQYTKQIEILKHYLSLPASTWGFERSFASILIAKAYRELKCIDDAERWFIRATAEEPNQREGWVELANHYRVTGDNLGSYAAVCRALRIPDSWHCFCSDPGAYDFWPHDLANIVGWWAGFKDRSFVHGWDALRTNPFMEHLIPNYEKALRESGRTPPPKIHKMDVIILSWAKTEEKYNMCKREINNLRASSPDTDFQIVVVESNKNIQSEPFTEEVLFGPDLTLMIPDENFGYNKFLALAYHGFFEESAPYLMILNDDVVAFNDGFAGKLIEGLKLFSSVCPSGLREAKWGRVDESKPHVIGYELNVVNGWCIAFDKAILKAASFETFFPPQIDFYYQDCYYAEMLKFRGLKHALITGAQALHLQAQSVAVMDKEARITYTFGQKSVFNALVSKNITHAPPPVIRCFDCFTFFNELELLEIRLNTLNSVVDKFVLVEATKTFSGKDKPLYFDEAKGDPRFKPFLGKIEHVIVDDMPSGEDRWAREYHQRNAIVRGLKTAGPSDIVLISDLDEIPRPEIVGSREVGAFRMDMFYYYYDVLNTVENWYGTVAVQAGTLTAISPQEYRNTRHRGHRIFQDGGWHFSWIGDLKRLEQKLHAFSHSEYDNEEVLAKLPERREKLVDFAGRSDKRFVAVPLKDLPGYLVANAERFAENIKAQPEPQLPLPKFEDIAPEAKVQA